MGFQCFELKMYTMYKFTEYIYFNRETTEKNSLSNQKTIKNTKQFHHYTAKAGTGFNEPKFESKHLTALPSKRL